MDARAKMKRLSEALIYPCWRKVCFWENIIPEHKAFALQRLEQPAWFSEEVCGWVFFLRLLIYVVLP